MKLLKLTVFSLGLLTMISCNSQVEAKKWTAFNREATFKKDIIHLNAKENDGVLWLNDFDFQDGTIELDIKGKDARGQSFVGLAFNGQDNEKYDAVYFRPFNFESTERKTHSVQYIAMPDYDWSKLRNTMPGKYENTITPVPDPNDWFHVKIEINFPNVTVYVNGTSKPSLEIEQINLTGHGKLGLWAGNGSEGWFKNIKITKKNENTSNILMDVGHGQKFWNNPHTMDKDNDQLQRVQDMTFELIKTLSKVNAQLNYVEDEINQDILKEKDALFIHIPSTQYSKTEVSSIQDYVKNGGNLFLVMDVDYWSSLEQTNVNEILAPFDITYQGKIPDSLSGGHTKVNPINAKPLKISYHGGRIVKGGTPFCFENETTEYSFGVYKEIKNGGRIVVMGDGMLSLYMTSWDGVDGYQCQEFMQDVFRWLVQQGF